MRLVLAAAALLLLTAPVGAQLVPSRITLDVVVDGAGSGAPLTSADFGVSDSDGPLTIESVQTAPSGAASEPLPAIVTAEDEQTAAAAARRIVGIFVDEYHIESGEPLAATRQALASFVRRTLGPRDLVIVMRPLDPLGTLRLTTDREASAATIERADGRMGDYAPRSTFEQDFFAGAPARIDAARAQITLSAIEALTMHLGRLPGGRKTLIVVSGGFVPRTEVRRDQPLPGVDGIIRSATRGRVAVYPIHLALSPREPEAADGNTVAAPADLLTRLARETTGLAVEGGAATQAGLERIARDASGYLVVTATPSAAAADGRLRPVTVTVRRPGVTVRARSGYTLPRAIQDDGALTPRPKPGLQVPRRTSPLIRPWFGLSPGQDARTRVSFVWEPSTGVPGERAVPSPSRVSIRVTTLEGGEVFAGTSNAAGRDPSGALDGSARLSFDAPKGQLLVQSEIFDAAGRTIDRDVRDLVVGGFPTPLAFGTPEVFRARTAREVRDVLANPDASPIVSRQFSRTEHLIVRVPMVSSGPSADVSAALASGFGAAMRELTVERLDGPRGYAQVDFPLAGLASGSYTIQFTARDSTGTVVDRVTFNVRP